MKKNIFTFIAIIGLLLTCSFNLHAQMVERTQDPIVSIAQPLSRLAMWTVMSKNLASEDEREMAKLEQFNKEANEAYKSISDTVKSNVTDHKDQIKILDMLENQSMINASKNKNNQIFKTEGVNGAIKNIQELKDQITSALKDYKTLKSSGLSGLTAQ